MTIITNTEICGAHQRGETGYWRPDTSNISTEILFEPTTGLFHHPKKNPKNNSKTDSIISITHLKTLLGKSKEQLEQEFDKYALRHIYIGVDTDEEGHVKVRLKGSERFWYPEHLVGMYISMIIEEFKDYARLPFQSSVTPTLVVCTFPCRSPYSFLIALTTSIKIAGISSSSICLLPEPLASLLAVEENNTFEALPPSSIIHLMDIGAGTADFITVHRYVQEQQITMKVIAYNVLQDHGGRKLDRIILSYVETMPERSPDLMSILSQAMASDTYSILMLPTNTFLKKQSE